MVRPGDRVIAIRGVPVAQAVAGFWTDLGLAAPDAVQSTYAARVLLAGRRDRDRVFTLQRAGELMPLTLPSLYAVRKNDRPPLTVTHSGAAWRIRLSGANWTIEWSPRRLCESMGG